MKTRLLIILGILTLAVFAIAYGVFAIESEYKPKPFFVTMILLNKKITIFWILNQ